MFRRVSLLLFAVVVLLAASIAEACPTCKLALGSHDAAQGDIVTAYMYSILFMMAMPFVTLGSFGTYIYFQLRRARRERAASTAAHAEMRQEEPVGA